MFSNFFRWPLPVAFAVAVSFASAQKPGSAARPDPLDAKASVPSFNYRSALENHRRLSDDKPVPWREANDGVGTIGGWRAYAREASEAAAPAGMAPTTGGAAVPMSAASAPSRSMPAGHGGHKTH